MTRPPLLLDGLARRGLLGLAFDDAPIGPAGPPGARVARVRRDSPAHRAGIAPGDLLQTVRSQPVDTPRAARAALAGPLVGTPIALTIARDGVARTVSLAPAPWPLEHEDDLAVTYRAVPAGDHRLRAVVTTPASGAGPWPTVLWVSGCSLGSVERPAPEAPLRCLVRALGRAGFAVVRVDKRSVGDSEGPPLADATLSDERHDHAAALRFTLGQPWCDRVFLLGHSLGGLLAPQLCAEVGPDRVAGLILYGVGSLTWAEYLARHTRAVGALRGLDPDAVDALVRRRQEAEAWLLVAGLPMEGFFAHCPAARADPGAYGIDPDGRIQGRAMGYWREVQTSPVIAPLRAAARPTLVAWGSCDWQSYRDEHLALHDALTHTHPGLSAWAEIPEADHEFAHRTSLADAFARWGGGPYAPAVDPTFLGWLKAQCPSRTTRVG